MSHKAYTIDEVLAFPPQKYLIGDILPMGLSLMAGQPKTGKSFIALDWALSIASGIRWMEKATVQGPVLYMQSEAPGTLPKRLDAWMYKHDKKSKDIDIRFDTQPTDLRDVERVCDDIAEHLDSQTLVVFDTLSKNNHGSETDDKDMPSLVRVCDFISTNFGASVLLVHHSTKENTQYTTQDGKSKVNVSSWYRGHGSLLAGIDAGISISRRTRAGDDLCIKMTCEAARHDEPFDPIALHIEPIRESVIFTPCHKDHGR